MISNQQASNLYEQYVEAWKPISTEQRAKILTEIFPEDIQYLIPQFEGGLEAVLEDLTQFQQKFPGAHFDIQDISTHHDVALFAGILVLADGTMPAKGHDQIRVSTEGKIASLITFAPSTPKP
jgi:hypothetical protein